MNLLSELLASLFLALVTIISSIGYLGIFLLMILESMILPVPSELVMPFAGFLIAEGKMGFLWVIVFSTLGSLIGSLLSYYLGRIGGNKLVFKSGRYFLLNKEHLLKTEKWFSKKGGITIFIGRFIPVVRHFISIPAGIGKMNLKKFIIYTLLGAGIWNTFLTYLGFLLGKNWEKVLQYSDYVSFGILAIIILVIGYFVLRRIGKKRK